MTSVSLPRKKLQEWDRSCAQNEAQKAHPQIISWLLHGGLFERNPYRVTALGCLEKKEDEQFWLSTVSGLPL